MTLDEFTHLPEADVSDELVDGRLEPLMAPYMPHGWTQTQLSRYLRHYPGDDFKACLRVEQGISTGPFHDRRPGLLYLTAEQVAEDDGDRAYPRDLVVEVISRDDPDRDIVVKRRELATTGSPHCSIAGPWKKEIELPALGSNDLYETENRFAPGRALTAGLLPGLGIPIDGVPGNSRTTHTSDGGFRRCTHQ